MNPHSEGGGGSQRLISPQHLKVRRALRIIGPVILVVGLLFTATGFISFLVAMGSHSGPPKLFWCSFVGLPLMFVGAALSMFAFMGAVARYAAAEQAPVAADTFNYVAEHTQSGVKTVAKTITQGVVEGMRAADETRDTPNRAGDNKPEK